MKLVAKLQHFLTKNFLKIWILPFNFLIFLLQFQFVEAAVLLGPCIALFAHGPIHFFRRLAARKNFKFQIDNFVFLLLQGVQNLVVLRSDVLHLSVLFLERLYQDLEFNSSNLQITDCHFQISELLLGLPRFWLLILL